MHRIFLAGTVSIGFALCPGACGEKDPDPCPDVPPCITGSVWNPTTCACLLEDEYRDAGKNNHADGATETDGGLDASETTFDAAPDASDAADETSD